MTNTKNLCLLAINGYLAKPPIIKFKSIFIKYEKLKDNYTTPYEKFKSLKNAK